MRKFIVSDLHGDGNIYNSIMSYIDNIKKEEDAIIYINGDLIDRGPDSAYMLLDVKRRIEEGQNIVYLGGNHELLMHQTSIDKKDSKFSYSNPWYANGGRYTDVGLWNLLDGDKDKLSELNDFVSNLNIYQLFDEKINNKNIVLVHAACPYEVKDECDLKIKDNDMVVDAYVWTRHNKGGLYYKSRIGDDRFFTIIGHTPIDSYTGYRYYKDDNYLNIDGGCAPYMCGFTVYDHVPLVEVKDGYLKILTFNNNNEITRGSYFIDNYSIKMKNYQLDSERKYLNKDVVVKKLVRDRYGKTYYEG